MESQAYDVVVVGSGSAGAMAALRARELGLEIETAQARQPYVEHEAARRVRQLALEEFRGRAEQLDPQADRAQQAPQRLADPIRYSSSGWKSHCPAPLLRADPHRKRACSGTASDSALAMPAG